MDFVKDNRFIILREFAKDILKFALIVKWSKHEDLFEKREDWVPETFEFAFGQAIFHYRESHIERFEEIFASYRDPIFDDEFTLLQYIKFGIRKITKGDALLMDFFRIMAFYVDLVLCVRRFENPKTYVVPITHFLSEIYSYAGIKEVLEVSESYRFLRRVGEEIIGGRGDQYEDKFVDRIWRYRASLLERYPERGRIALLQRFQILSNFRPPSETGRLANIERKLAIVPWRYFRRNGSTHENNRSQNDFDASRSDIDTPSASGPLVRDSSSTPSDEGISGECLGEESNSEIIKSQSILKSPQKGVKRGASSDENASKERKRSKIILSSEACEDTNCPNEDHNNPNQEFLIPISDPISEELRVSLNKILEDILMYNKAVKELAIRSYSSPEMPEVSQLDENQHFKNNAEHSQVIRGVPCTNVASYVTVFGYSDDTENRKDNIEDNTVKIEEEFEKMDSEKEMYEDERDEKQCEDEDSDNTNNTKYMPDDCGDNYETGDESHKRNTNLRSTEEYDNPKTNQKNPKRSKPSKIEKRKRPEIFKTNFIDDESESRAMDEEESDDEVVPTEFCSRTSTWEDIPKSSKRYDDTSSSEYSGIPKPYLDEEESEEMDEEESEEMDEKESEEMDGEVPETESSESYKKNADSSSSENSDNPKTNLKKTRKPKRNKTKKRTRPAISDKNSKDDESKSSDSQYPASSSSDDYKRTSKENTDSNSSENSENPEANLKKPENLEHTVNKEMKRPKIPDTSSKGNKSESKETEMDLDCSKIDFISCKIANDSDNSLNKETSGDSICELDAFKNIKIRGIEKDSNDCLNDKSSDHTKTSINMVEGSSEVKHDYKQVDFNIDQVKSKKIKRSSGDSNVLAGSCANDSSQLDSACVSDVSEILQAGSTKLGRDSGDNMLSENLNVVKPFSPPKFQTSSNLVGQPVVNRDKNVYSSSIEKKFGYSGADDSFHDSSFKIVAGCDSVRKSNVSNDEENVQKNLDSSDSYELFGKSETDSSKDDNSTKTLTSSEFVCKSDASKDVEREL